MPGCCDRGLSIVKGLIQYGINNIYAVYSAGKTYRCRIKGKILGSTKKEYNPLAPGDYVAFEPDTHTGREGLIIDRFERKNSFSRWNKKKKTTQTVAANIDSIVCIASPQSPPFRPRFIDRVSVIAEMEHIPFTVILNKMDQHIDRSTQERLTAYKKLGYAVLTCSALKKKQLAPVKEHLMNKTSVLIGQSGVGKSSLINAIYPHINLKTGSISLKYNRGTHTTVYAELLLAEEDTALIDTPGIREIEVAGIDPEDLQYYFPDFHNVADTCEFQPCSHTHEPGCSVIEAVENGSIHQDRYRSYITIYHDLKEKTKLAYG